MHWYLEIAIATSMAWMLVIGPRIMGDRGHTLRVRSSALVGMVVVGIAWPLFCVMSVLNVRRNRRRGA